MKGPEADPFEFDDELKELLEARRAEALESSGDGESWETVKAELWPDL